MNSPVTVGISFINRNQIDLRNPYGDRKLLENSINESFRNFGLGKTNVNLPIKDIVHEGMGILLKPNWVLHKNLNDSGMDSMITNWNILIILVEQLLKCNPSKILIADAPIQGCEWFKLVNSDLINEINKIDTERIVSILDLRKVLTNSNISIHTQIEQRKESDYILFDLEKNSLLEDISKSGKFRVTMYDPKKLQLTHKKNKHLYLISKEPFDVDVIINIPKLKTHRKACFTGALKNLVGLVGSKDFLPHHRVGGSFFGGDCYKGIAPLKRMTEYLLDIANQNIGNPNYSKWSSRAYKLLDFHKSLFNENEIEGGWYGNDTIWRTVLDLNRILLYGKKDGTMSDIPQRQILTLTDAIICGEGEGPLAPQPLFVGVITFSNSTVATDLLNVALLRFDFQKIPVLKNALINFRFPLTFNGLAPETLKINFQNQILTLNEIAKIFGKNAKPSAGWRKHCELDY